MLPKALSLVDLQAAIAREPLVVSSDMPVMTAVTHMDQAGSDCAVVVEAERVVGVFTERDVVRLVCQHCSLDEQTLGAVLTQPVVTLPEAALNDSDCATLLALLQHHGICHLPLVDDQDRLAGMLTEGILQQVILQGELLQALAESQAQAQRFKAQATQNQAILDAIPDLMFRVGADGLHRGVITQPCGFDLVPQTIDRTGQSLAEVLPPEVAERHDHYLHQALATGELQIYEQQVQANNGTASEQHRLQYEEIRAIPYGEDEVLFIVRDISEQKQAEQALRQSEQTHRTLVETLPDLLIQMDREGYYKYMAGGNAVHVQYPSGLFSGPELYEFLSPEWAEHRLHRAHQALETGETQVYEQLFEFEGSSFNEEVRIAPLNDQEVLILVRDITEQKHLAAEREKALVALRQSEQLHRTLCETQPDLIIHMDREGNYKRRVGGDAFRIRNLSKTQVSTVYGILPPELAQQQIAHAHQALETGHLQTFKHHFEFEGQQHSEEVRIAPLNEQEVLIVVRDISEQTELEAVRQQVEAALVESERRFRTLFEDTPKLAVRGYARDRRIIYWNQASEQLYGYSAAEAIGQPVEELIVPFEDRSQVVERLAAWTTGEIEIPAGEMELVAQDGTRLTVFSNHIAFTNRAGERELYCMDIDLGPLRQTEQELQALNQSLEATVAARTIDLQEREQFLQTVLDTFPLSVFWKDRASRFLGCNRNFLRDAGLTSVAEIIGKSDYEMPWGDTEAEFYQADDRQVIESETAKIGIIESQIPADGNQVWLETNKLPLRNVVGEVIGVLGTYQDITERKEAEIRLQASEARYRALVEVIPDLMVRLRADGLRLDVVPGGAVILLNPEQTVAGSNIYEALPRNHAETRMAHVQRAIETREIQIYDYDIWVEDQLRYEEARVIAINDQEVLIIIRDITERKQAEAQLRRYERIVSATTDGVAVVDRNYVYQVVNQTYLDRNGKTRQEIVGHSVAELLGEAEFQSQIKPHLDSCLKGEVVQYQDWFDFFGMGRRFVNVSYAPYREADGSISGVVVGTCDLTDQTRLEQQLAQTSQQLQAFVENAPAAISCFDRHGRYLQVNQACADWLGMPKDQILGRTFTDFFSDAQVQTWLARIQLLIDTGQSLKVEDELQLQRETQTFECILFAIRDEAGHPTSFWSISTDITARKQAEAELAASRTYYQGIVADQTELICRFLPDGTLTFVNDAYCAFFQKSPEELLGHSFVPLLPEEDRGIPAENFSKLSVDNPHSTCEHRVIAPNGNIRWQQWTDRLLFDPDGNCREIQAVGRDITDLKEVEATLHNLAAITATGSDFFSELVFRMAQALTVTHVIVAEKVDDTLQTLAVWSDGALQPNFTYAYAPTPCESTLKDGWFYCEDQLQERFPNDPLVEMAAESYLGIALHNAQSEAIGVLCLLSRDSLKRHRRTEQLLRIFAARAAAELQRQQVIAELERLNHDLEAKVLERTMALQEREIYYRTLIEGASDGILIADQQGNFIDANRQAEVLLGYTQAEITSMHFSQIHPPEDLPAINGLFEELINQQTASVVDINFLSKTGKRLPMDVSLAVIEIRGQKIAQGILRDTSERKRLEADRQQLIQELSEFKLALDQSAIVAITDAKGVITYVNNRFCQVSGYAPNELLGRTHRVVNSGQHSPDFFQDLWRTISSGEIWRGEICNRTKAGDLYWVESTIVPFVNDQGRPFQYLTIRFDITDRKQAENTIRQQAQREKLLRETDQLIRESLDLPTIFSTACEAICALLKADRVGIFQFGPGSGFNEGEFVAEAVVAELPSVMEIRVRDDYFQDNYAALYKQGRFQVIDDINHHDLQPCHVELLAQFQIRAQMVMPLCSGETLWGLLCIHQCTTTRHWQKAEIDLTQRLVIQLGIAIQQASFYEQLQQELTQRQQTQQQLTERNRELDRSNQELARATRLKDEFLANMSHELRTPLNAILGMAEGLQESVFGPVIPKQAKALQTIERSGNHLLNLINDILDVAKIEAGQMELHCTAVAPGPLCRSSLAFVKQQAQRKRIQLETQLPVDLPDLWIDERRILQVLINLLTNAVKFTDEGGRVTLTVSHQKRTLLPTEPEPLQGITRVKVYQTPLEQNLARFTEEPSLTVQDYLRITVVDTGIGIAPTEMHKLFQPFVQIDSALNRQYEGTGLGLALVKRLVEFHGGQVAVSSKVGIGSRFSIELPCCLRCPIDPGAGANTSSQEKAEVRPRSEVTEALILLAEDNEANIRTVSSYLKAKGYQILVANDGRAAIATAQSEQPDLILMDIQMPEMDGLEAIAQIRQDPSLAEVPIIAMTALAMPDDRDRCLSAGANAYLSKPVKLKQVVTTIQDLLSAQPK